MQTGQSLHFEPLNSSGSRCMYVNSKHSDRTVDIQPVFAFALHICSNAFSSGASFLRGKPLQNPRSSPQVKEMADKMALYLYALIKASS